METTAGSALAMSRQGIDGACEAVGAAPPAVWAMLSTETSGCGYQPDGRTKILFERHVFHRLTGGRFDAQDPDVSALAQGGYGAGGAHQYVRLHAAMLLDEEAALQSASWGLGQIMGFNHKAAGFADVRAMIAAFGASEDAQIAATATFMTNSGMAAALAAGDWARFARLYNGPDYAKNGYDAKLRHFCGIYQARGVPDLALRTVQLYLTFLGYPAGGVDGIEGKATDAAIQSFCLDENSEIMKVGPPLIGRLRAEVVARGIAAAA